MNLRLIAIPLLALTLGSAGCSLVDDEPPPSESAVAAPADVPDIRPTHPIERAELYGLEPGDEATDQYGTFTQWRATDPDLIIDLDDAVVDPEVWERSSEGEVWILGTHALDYMLRAVIDSPLVFDDSNVAQKEFWSIADDYMLFYGGAVSYFESHVGPEPFVLVDDNRGNWRQDAGMLPAPYVDGVPRVKIMDLELKRVSYRDGENPGPSYRFSVTYARPIVDADGTPSWEAVDMGYSVHYGYDQMLRPTIVSIGFWGESYQGMFVEGGSDALPSVEQGDAAVDVVTDSTGATFALPTGWSGVNDMDAAADRGINPTNADRPDIEWSYYEGPELAEAAPPYVVTMVIEPGADPYTSTLEQRIQDAELPDEYFLGDNFTSVNVEVERARSTLVELIPGSDEDDYDTVLATVVDRGGSTHRAVYYLELGTGEASLQDIINGISLPATSGEGRSLA